MLKKLLKGCLTAAMVTAMAVSVSAETTFTWSGNATGTLKQTTSKASVDGADSFTEMDMLATGDLDLVVTVPGDQWTGKAYFDLDFDAAATKVDDLYVEMSNDAFAISLGEFDPVGIGQGHEYTAEIDDTYGAGGNLLVPNEQGWLRVELKEVGLSVFLGFNETAFEYSAAETTDVGIDGENLFDASSDGDYASTAFGLTFKKTFSIVDLGVQYVSMSAKRDDSNSAHVAEDTAFDGLSTSELSLAVTGNFSEMMALTLNYCQGNISTGIDDDDTDTYSTMELVFDMGLSDTMGFSVAYNMYGFDDGSGNDGAKTDGTLMIGTFKLATGGVDHYIAYQSRKLKNDADNAEEATETIFGYSMKVAF